MVQYSIKVDTVCRCTGRPPVRLFTLLYERTTYFVKLSTETFQQEKRHAVNPIFYWGHPLGLARILARDADGAGAVRGEEERQRGEQERAAVQQS